VCTYGYSVGTRTITWRSCAASRLRTKASLFSLLKAGRKSVSRSFGDRTGSLDIGRRPPDMAQTILSSESKKLDSVGLVIVLAASGVLMVAMVVAWRQV